MDYKEKYEMALEGIQEILSSGEDSIKMSRLQMRLQGIFPELKESEDERIRKAIHIYLDWLDGRKDYAPKGKYTIKDMIAWLEKQVPACLSHDDEIMIRQLTEYFTTGKGLQNTNDTVVEWLEDVKRKLEKQGEQESIDHDILIQQQVNALDDIVVEQTANKVEPKFKIGDWITDGDNTTQIVAVGTGLYIINRKGMSEVSLSTKYIDAWYHLWTIQDAKDGDVLVHSSSMFDDFIFIYNNTSILQAYCYYSSERNRFIIEDRGHHCPWNMQEVTPATREQRDILMKSMADAGYTFDFEKKELKKIEQKQEWSEEDEHWRQKVIDFMKHPDLIKATPTLAEHTTEWLKSLKERYTWKPSDDHYELEEFAKIVRGNLTGISEAVQALFENKYLKLTGREMYGGFKD